MGEGEGWEWIEECDLSEWSMSLQKECVCTVMQNTVL